jgi:chemotaxis signal transduction protein
MRDRAAELRQLFDRSFAQALRADDAGTESLLAVRIRSHGYAVRLSDIAGVFVDKKVTPLPSAVAELLGLAGFRGTVLPVYNLGRLLGYTSAQPPPWLIVTAGTAVGLAFDAFDGHLRVDPGAIVPDLRGGLREQHVRDVLHADVARPIVDVASVLASIRRLTQHASAKEH